MSVYSVKGKGWRYDFTLQGIRYTEAWFKTKTEAKQAEARKKEEIKNPKPEPPIDTGFLELVNLRLDHVKAYNSQKHYQDYVYHARRWVKRWGNLTCNSVTNEMINIFILERNKVSAYTANKEIRLLRATFNFGKKKKYITSNPVDEIEFFPIRKKIKHVPSINDIDKVINVATSEAQDYLWVIRETLGRVSEINRLAWNDVNFKERHVILYTRKKNGGHLTPRKVPMTEKLYDVLLCRFLERDETKPWVFWHRYWSKKDRKFKQGPYQDRKVLMKTLCKKAGVTYFRYHPLRHAGASIMDNNNVPMGSIQRILGHEHRTTTEIYLHSVSNAERDAMSVYESARRNSDSHTNSHTK
jgi:integrase